MDLLSFAFFIQDKSQKPNPFVEYYLGIISLFINLSFLGSSHMSCWPLINFNFIVIVFNRIISIGVLRAYVTVFRNYTVYFNFLSAFWEKA